MRHAAWIQEFERELRLALTAISPAVAKNGADALIEILRFDESHSGDELGVRAQLRGDVVVLQETVDTRNTPTLEAQRLAPLYLEAIRTGDHESWRQRIDQWHVRLLTALRINLAAWMLDSPDLVAQVEAQGRSSVQWIEGVVSALRVEWADSNHWKLSLQLGDADVLAAMKPIDASTSSPEAIAKTVGAAIILKLQMKLAVLSYERAMLHSIQSELSDMRHSLDTVRELVSWKTKFERAFDQHIESMSPGATAMAGAPSTALRFSPHMSSPAETIAEFVDPTGDVVATHVVDLKADPTESARAFAVASREELRRRLGQNPLTPAPLREHLASEGRKPAPGCILVVVGLSSLFGLGLASASLVTG